VLADSIDPVSLPSHEVVARMAQIIYPKLSYEVQGAFYDVYNELRFVELSEEGWENALLIALEQRGISAERQVEYELRYRGYRIGRFFVDVLADGRLLLELKVRDALRPIDQAQVLTYLKASSLKLGILVNFGAARLDFERIPNFLANRSPERLSDNAISHSPDDLLFPELTGELRGALYAVHNELGPGFMHMHYRRATQIELRLRGVPYEVKKEIVILFRGQPIETRETRLLIVDDKVLLAPVAVRKITPELRARLHQYLQHLELDLGLLANFHETRLDIRTVRL
jgi:GxxExxY protein